MSSNEAADFLMGSNSPSAKFPAIGATVSGTVSRVGAPMQQRDISTGEPKVWSDGNPMMQLPVDVATDERDAEIPNDDGTRTLYIKGNMQSAIREAVRRSGAKMLEVGGTLTVRYASDGTAAKKGFNPPKVYEATYVAPSGAAAAAFLNSDAPDAPAPADGGGGEAVSPEVQKLLDQLAQQGVKATVAT